MRDPHVVLLIYTLVPEETTSFSAAAAPVEADAGRYSLRLADGTLTVTMHDHFPSEESAREAVERYLRAWEIRHALALGIGRMEFRFEFQRAELVDRDPPPPGEPQTIELKSLVHLRAIGSVTAHAQRAAYPAPPSDFALDPDVETLWTRWQGYVASREPLQTMAYFCLTVLQSTAGDRASAAARYVISGNVLDTLARLSTETGDAATARKMGRKLRPLTDAERTWLEAAVRAVVRRAGEVAADPTAAVPKLTMSDLPPLPGS